MTIALNIGISAIVLLIAYWWANQGVFSALMHLIAVIVAGAVALGFWETLTALILSGGGFDSYAWGVVLVMTFAVTLFVVRFAFDKLAPANIRLPRWANLAFGAPLGGAAGVLTVGMLLIGAGFVQSRADLLGHAGHARNPRNGKVEQIGTGLWAPVHQWTSDFYGMLSVNAFSTSTPLRSYYPELGQQSLSLFRDTYKKGRGKVAMPEDAAKVNQWNWAPGQTAAAVTVEFENKARDYGEQLTVSQAQVRLIERVSGKAAPRVVHPIEWFQDGEGPFRFDDVTHYMTSVPARQNAVGVFAFQVPANFRPRFIQIKGVRLELPESRRQEGDVAGALVSGAPEGATPFGGRDISAVVEVTNDIRPIRTDLNRMPGTIKEVDRYLTEGEATFPRAGFGRVPRELMILGLYETTGSRVVQVDVSRTSPANLFDEARERARDNDRIVLVDEQGFRYPAIGYIYEHEAIELKLDPKNNVDTIAKIPTPPTSGDQRLRLLFQVTEGARIVALMMGDVTVGRLDLVVPAQRP